MNGRINRLSWDSPGSMAQVPKRSRAAMEDANSSVDGVGYSGGSGADGGGDCAGVGRGGRLVGCREGGAV